MKSDKNVAKKLTRHFVYLVNSSAIIPQNDFSKFATVAEHFVHNLCTVVAL